VFTENAFVSFKTFEDIRQKFITNTITKTFYTISEGK